MAKLADALDLGSSGQPYGFKSLQLHQNTEFMLGVFLLRDFVLSAPRYACEPILCGWRSFLCASTTSRYYVHSVLYKSLQLHQNTEFMLGVFLLRDFVLSAPRYACEPILCGWRSFLCASTTSRYYVHSVLYKSLQLHQKMAMSV